MIYVVLPAFDEVLSIGKLLDDFYDIIQRDRTTYHLVIVDDGSSDGTDTIISLYAKNLPLTILTHEWNKGLAEALKTGLLYTIEVSTEKDIVVTMDADHSHLPGLISRMVGLLREGCDIVIASRYQPGAYIRGLSLSRRMLSRIASIIFRMLFPIKMARDYTCGYRAYRASLLRKAFNDYGKEFISQSGFSCMVDILLRLRCYDPIVMEVPLILRYDQKLGKSKMKVAKTIIESIKLIMQRKREELINRF